MGRYSKRKGKGNREGIEVGVKIEEDVGVKV